VLAAIAVVLFALRVLEFEQLHERWFQLMLYFENWVLCLGVVYFTLAAALTSFSTCTEGAESNSTPVMVWVTWATYGALLPASIVNAIAFAFVTNRYTVTGTLAVQGGEINRIFDVLGVFGILLMAILDAWINRQPYYATYHAFLGALTCWGYLVFNVVFTLVGQNNELGQPYIYRALNWRTTDIARQVTPGKVTVAEVFFFVPLLNALYWCMLWARRRARVAAKQSAV